MSECSCKCTACTFVGTEYERLPHCGIEPCHEVAPSRSAAPEPSAKCRVFVDMDGVVVDFDSYKYALGLTGDEVKKRPGAYLEMKAFPEALKGIKWLIGSGYEVWLATKPPTGIAFAYSDKAEWVFRNLPELKKRIIITHDKGLIGCAADILIDDRPHKANCEKFSGTLIPFVNGETWDGVIEKIKQREASAAPPSEREVATERLLIDRSLVEGLRSFMNRRFDQDRLLKYQTHFMRELDAVQARAAVPQAAGDKERERFISRLRDGLTRMRDGDNSGPSAQHMLEWVEQEDARAAAVPAPGETFDILVASLQTIADFAPGNGDVCEIIAKRARAALAKVERAGATAPPKETE